MLPTGQDDSALQALPRPHDEPWRVRQLALMALAAPLLAVSHLVVRFGLRLVSGWLFGPSNGATPSLRLRHAVRRAVLAWSRRLPVRRHCLANAMAAKLLLALFGCASTVCLGVGRHAAGRHDAGHLHAHAWLEADGAIVIGARARRTVKALR